MLKPGRNISAGWSRCLFEDPDWPSVSPMTFCLLQSQSNCNCILTLKAKCAVVSLSSRKHIQLRTLSSLQGERRGCFVWCLVSYVTHKAWLSIKAIVIVRSCFHVGYACIGCCSVRKGSVMADGGFTSLVWKMHLYTELAWVFFRLFSGGWSLFLAAL